jgi:hypothetical protein
VLLQFLDLAHRPGEEDNRDVARPRILGHHREKRPLVVRGRPHVIHRDDIRREGDDGVQVPLHGIQRGDPVALVLEETAEQAEDFGRMVDTQDMGLETVEMHGMTFREAATGSR